MNFEFSINALGDLQYWTLNDKKKALRILKLIEEILKNPFKWTWKPEVLKYNLAWCWSRRIDQTHRLVYKVDGKKVVILACRYHY